MARSSMGKLERGGLRQQASAGWLMEEGNEESGILGPVEKMPSGEIGQCCQMLPMVSHGTAECWSCSLSLEVFLRAILVEWWV